MINCITFDKNYCEPCYNNHADGIMCLALSDSENECQCLCSTSLKNIEGLSPQDIRMARDNNEYQG